MSKIQIKLFIKIMIKIIELKIKVMKKNLKKTVKRIIFKKIKIILINILMIDKINLTNHIIKINKIKNFLLINNFNLKTQMNNLINKLNLRIIKIKIRYHNSKKIKNKKIINS